MKRDELIKLLETADRTEEESVATLSQHVQAAMAFSNCTDAERARADEILDMLHRESLLHHAILKGLRRRIERERNDVY